MTEGRGQKTEDRGRRTDDGRQRTEDSRRKAEIENRNEEVGVESNIGNYSELESEIPTPKSEIRAVPIIALTASAFEEDRNEMIAQGCDDFVRKPFRESEIFGMLEKHLGIQFDRDQYDVERRLSADDGIIENLKSAAAALPDEMRARLTESTELSDAAMIGQAIDDIRIQNAYLADALASLADNFAYDKILDLVA